MIEWFFSQNRPFPQKKKRSHHLKGERARTQLKRRLRMGMGRLRRKPLKIPLPNRNRNIIRAAQPQNSTVAYNGPTGRLDYTCSRPHLIWLICPTVRII